MRRLATFLIAWGGVSVAAAQPPAMNDFDAYERARVAYDGGDYQASADGFFALVGGEEPRLTSRPLILESRKYLGASYVFLGRREEAESEFIRLLELDSEYQMDPVTMAREVLEVWVAVERRVRAQRAEEELERRRLDEERRRSEADRLAHQQEMLIRLRTLAEEEVVERENSRWIAFIPFGLGQFQNENRSFGIGMATTQAAFLATSIATAIIRAGVLEEARAGNQSAQRYARNLRYTNWSATAAFAAFAIIGIVEANLSFRPVVRERRRRELPPDLREGLELVVSPTGLELRF